MHMLAAEENSKQIKDIVQTRENRTVTINAYYRFLLQ